MHGSNHFHNLGMREREHAANQRHIVSNSLDSINLIQSNDSSLNALTAGANNQQTPQNQNNTSGQASGTMQENAANGSPQPGQAHQGHGSHQMSHNGGSHQAHQVVQLNKKILGNRKRNNRDKSYDSYNQKLQLPPMIKTPQDRSDRTYSVPTSGGGHAGTNSASGNAGNSNNLVHGHHHQYMLPLSPQANQSAGAGGGALAHHGHSHFAH